MLHHHSNLKLTRHNLLSSSNRKDSKLLTRTSAERIQVSSKRKHKIPANNPPLQLSVIAHTGRDPFAAVLKVLLLLTWTETLTKILISITTWPCIHIITKGKSMKAFCVTAFLQRVQLHIIHFPNNSYMFLECCDLFMPNPSEDNTT